MTEPSQKEKEPNKAIEALEKSKALYKALVRTSPDAIQITDLKGKIIEVSDKTLEITGAKSPEELIGRTSFDFIAPEDKEMAMTNLLKTLKEGELKPTVYNLLRLDGSKYIGELSASVIENNEGKPVAFLGVVRDITERKIAEDMIKESEEKYRLISENANDIIVILNKKFIIEYINENTALRLLGYKKEEMLGRRAREFGHPDEFARFDINVPRAVQKGEGMGEIRFRHKNGSWIWLDIKGKVFRDNEGKIKILLIGRDITERKQTEQQLKESEERYRYLFENSPFSIVLIDLEGKIIGFNIMQEKTFGYSEEDLIGKEFYNIGVIHSDILPSAMDAFKKVIKGEGRQEVELLYLKKGGGMIWGLTEGSIVKTGDISFVQVIIQDITEKKEAEQKLKESEEKFRTITEQSLMGIAILQDNKVKYINQQFANLSGYTIEEAKSLQPRDIFESIHPEDREMVIEQMNKKQKGLKDYIIHYAYRIIKKTGETVWVDNYSKTINYRGSSADLVAAINITEKKRAEQELKESEEKYRELVENINATLYIIDINGLISYISPVIETIIGFKPSEVVNRPFTEFIYKEDLPRAIESFQKTMSGQSDRIELRLLTKNGQMRWIYTYATPVFKDNKIIGNQGLLMDITERKNAEQQLKESEARYRYLFEKSPFSISIMDFQGNIIEINTETEKLVGYKKEELIGQNYLKLNVYNKEMLPALARRLERLQKGESLEPLEVLITRKDGKEIWVSSHLSVVNLGYKKFIQVIILDINAQKIYQKELKESEEKYRSILENIKEGYFEVDLDGTLLFVNDAFCEVMGYSRKELLGKNYTLFMDEKNAQKIYRVYNQIYRSGISQINFDYETRRKDGEIVYVDSSAYLKNDENGNKIGFYGFGRDFTERKKAELLIKEEVEKLKELDQIRKDLTSRVSHELKTPLATISGASELLLSVYKDTLGKDPLELVEIIEKGGGRLKKLVGNLLDVSRIEFKKLKLEKDTHDLCEIVRDCIKDMNHLARERKIDLSLDCPEDLVLKVDRIRIEQVITNLLSNAIKNTPPKGKINVTIEKYQKWAIINVADTGIGLTIEERKILYERFGKIERYGEGLEYIDIGGSGLGLYISKEIVDLHKGKIWVESDGRNKGTSFFVRLPIE
jgi:PAS domain S-box-containing protein